MQLLNEYIQKIVSSQFEFGVTDCCSTVDNWVQIKRGVSPLKEYGQKPSEEWLKSEGIVRAVKKVLRNNKLVKTRKPEIGDIGLILSDKVGIAMAIKHTDTNWIVKSEKGLFSISTPRVLTAWKV